jgi:DNA-binding MarR family transcriptional regulator
MERDKRKKTRYRVYDFIVWYKKEYDGNSPSVREIAEAVEVASSSTIYIHIDKLVDEGLLYRHPHIDKGSARCLMVTGGEWGIRSAENDTSG